MPQPRPMLRGFIDEAGDRSRKSPVGHFVMSAVLIPDASMQRSTDFLAELRKETGRGPNDVLHFRKLQHQAKVHATRRMAGEGWITISSVVVCKRELTGALLDDDKAYLYTLRYLLERMSWYARDNGFVLDYTIAHIVRFQLAKLREYEEKLRADRECRIDWKVFEGRRGSIDQPNRIEQLQLADIAASATWHAFEPDAYGNTEPRYLQNIASRLYRRGSAPLTSYGLKVHPWSSTTEAAYPWVAAL